MQRVAAHANEMWRERAEDSFAEWGRVAEGAATTGYKEDAVYQVDVAAQEEQQARRHTEYGHGAMRAGQVSHGGRRAAAWAQGAGGDDRRLAGLLASSAPGRHTQHSSFLVVNVLDALIAGQHNGAGRGRLGAACAPAAEQRTQPLCGRDAAKAGQQRVCAVVAQLCPRLQHIKGRGDGTGQAARQCTSCGRRARGQETGEQRCMAGDVQ